MAKNVAMQIAALNPKYTNRSEVSEEYIAHEKEILMAQIQNDPKESQKPEKVIQGMISGRINKELKEICLLDQVYVKAEDGRFCSRSCKTDGNVISTANLLLKIPEIIGKSRVSALSRVKIQIS